MGNMIVLVFGSDYERVRTVFICLFS